MTLQSPFVPDDELNRQLAASVRPADWINPQPSGRYNLVVIGAGTAGLVTAAGAAALGAKVALIERHVMGGDCLNYGCVPSKAVIRAARQAAAIRRASEFGVRVPQGVSIDFPAVMERMRRLRAHISPADSARRFRDLGVDVYFGAGRFVDEQTVDVNGTKLRFRRAVIATGARAAIPAIPGIESVNYLTNETVFSLTALPRRLCVIGAGPIGCELAQAFAQLGSQVLMVESEHGILPREDREAAEIVRSSLLRDGVKIICCSRGVQLRNDGRIRVRAESHGTLFDEQVDELLIAGGRTPNIDDLDLAAACVAYHEKGVTVNSQLRTSNPRIYAAGDVCSRYQFTHAADFMARIVIRNSLFFGRAKSTALTIPWCTYTSPELAHVGLSQQEAESSGQRTETLMEYFKDVDRAVLDGEEEGFVKVHLRRGTDHILGATIVASHAGDLISEMTLAMTNGLGLRKLGKTIHPYPTQADALRRLGDQYNRLRLTPSVRSVFERWMRWMR